MTYDEIFLKGGVNKAIFVYAMAKYMFENLGYYTGNQTNLVDKIEKFLEQEAKPTLTEDERVILRNIDKRFNRIQRNEFGYLILTENGCEKIGEAMHTLYAFNHLFQFIKERRRIRNKGVTI